jgi:hypothetical protein
MVLRVSADVSEIQKLLFFFVLLFAIRLSLSLPFLVHNFPGLFWFVTFLAFPGSPLSWALLVCDFHGFS